MAKNKDFFKIVPKAMQIMIKMEQYIKEESTIDPLLYELIKTRASQINGCAYCLDMHTKDALKIGETSQRLFLLSAWRETSLFTDKEKAALELTEQVTQISQVIIDEDLHDLVLKHFTEKEFADLIIIINQINAWNRINITMLNDIDHSY
ncbi:MAG: carboxymuconolactone decarboxylase family protein [Acholeplasmataceae bacterium]|nr:carboxymuconolactone decarboxylase family protein [Acholeplasmataceae bacterium]